MKRDFVPDGGMIKFEGAPVDYNIVWRTDQKFRLSFLANPAEDAANLFIEFQLRDTASPSELFGKFDKRKLGISLRRIIYEAA